MSQRQTILVGVILGALVIIGAILYIGRRPSFNNGGTLTMWGVFDSADDYKPIFDAFKNQTGIKITYVQKDVDTYERDLINALASGQGPDIVMVHNDWLPKHASKFRPAPQQLFTPQDMINYYPAVVAQDFVKDDQVYAVPLSVDTLALYYNKDLLDQAGIPFPPKTWEDLVQEVPQLTKINSSGQILRSAAALGTTSNINRPTDILSLLMMQAGAKIIDSQTHRVDFDQTQVAGQDPPGVNAVQFYTQFADSSKKVYTWNSDQHYSINAFTEGALAMMFNYAYQQPLLKAQNPYLNFAIAPMLQPQDLANSGTSVNYANYWGYGVAWSSPNSQAAWQFISFLTSLDSATAYMQQTGYPPARRELIQETLNDNPIGIFSRQALTAQSWYQPDPDATEQIFQNMINSVVNGNSSVAAAVRQADDQINLLLNKNQ